jgi:predicted AAA+ superfamily ATPase
MKVTIRNLQKVIEKDLEQKFVFLSGPRQIGKTTLAKQIINKKKGVYLLYDDENDRRTILKKEYFTHKWVCLDEFHKFQRWKNHIKGVFDKYHDDVHLILTGSARLDIFQKSGDSLFGRYYLHHLHPLTCGELETPEELPNMENIFEFHKQVNTIDDLLKYSGFPEPFYKQSIKEYRRWSNARNSLLVREDMRELTQIKLISLVDQLMLLLPERIGSLFSYRSLSEDLRVSTPTVQNWMDIFQRLFIVFRISPYTKKITRSIQKQPKYYLYDWCQVSDEGHMFENFIASHLWKACQIWTDTGEGNMDLHFIRDRMGREVDFLILKDRKPWFLVESKLAETKVDPNLKYFCGRLKIPGLQIIRNKNVLKEDGPVTVISADRWLANLP